MLIYTYETLLLPKWIAASIISWLNNRGLFDISLDTLAETILLTRWLPGYLKNLSKANLRGAFLTCTDLSGANLSGADLSGANLSEADLSGANLSRANLKGAELWGVDLSMADLSGANLSMANLSMADLSGANLSRADLKGANLSRADLSMADLSGANLSEADLSGAELWGVDLSGADLSGANLSEADLCDADLSKSNLSGANLSRACLSSTDLSDADLSNADLSEITFYLFTWDDSKLNNDELKRLLKSEPNRLEGKDIQYQLKRNSLLVKSGSRKAIIKLKEDGKAIWESYMGNVEIIPEEELLVVKEDGKTKIYRNVRVSEGTKTTGIILTHSNDEQSIIKALENLPPDFRRIVLRDNPHYKSIWDKRSSLGNTPS